MALDSVEVVSAEAAVVLELVSESVSVLELASDLASP
jgi:hypothetical protein